MKKKWTSGKIETLMQMRDDGKSLEYLGDYFNTSKEAISMQLSLAGYYKKQKITGETFSSLNKIRSAEQKDYAQRLMVLQGLEVRKPELFEPFSDDELLSWKDVNQFCKSLLFWQGAPLQLLEYQKLAIVMVEENKYSIFLAGRQVGKDMVASVIALWKCITTPNFFVIIVSPAQRQSDEMFRRIQHFIASGDIYNSVKISRADEIEFSNGSRIMSLPSRGAITGLTAVHMIIINEAGRPELPENIIDDVMPMTMSVGGKLLLMGNPYSKTSQFYQHYQSPLFAKLHVKTSLNTSLPNLTEFLEAERTRCTKNEYLQQYEGVFADFPNAFIPSNLLESSIEDYDYSLKPHEAKYYAGIDWGLKIDESVLIVVSMIGDGHFKVEYCESWSGQSLSHCTNKLRHLDGIFNFARICPEDAGLSGDEVGKIKDEFGARVSAFIPTNESQFKGYNTLLKQFENGTITLPMHEVKLINQLRYLELKETSTGKYRVDHPSGRKNDYTDALMMAINGAVVGYTGGGYISIGR